MWCLLEWRWDQGGTPYPFKGVSISCWSGEGSVPERVPCGDQNKFPNISNFRLCFGESEEGCQGPWRNSSLGQHQVLPSAVT